MCPGLPFLVQRVTRVPPTLTTLSPNQSRLQSKSISYHSEVRRTACHRTLDLRQIHVQNTAMVKTSGESGWSLRGQAMRPGEEDRVGIGVVRIENRVWWYMPVMPVMLATQGTEAKRL